MCIKTSRDLERLILAGLKGDVDVTEEISKTNSFKTYSKLVVRSDLDTEFLNVASMIDTNNAINLKTLISELQKNDLQYITSTAPNFITALKILMIFAPTSAEAERSFSKMKLIKTRLRNRMGMIGCRI